mmetsp:Transcript_68218/g.200320  ORF Transcript_68218/g.200320 Transcript_68218/m.200320 type:complete len:239 (+) Transcript_68218:170-886(+)
MLSTSTARRSSSTSSERTDASFVASASLVSFSATTFSFAACQAPSSTLSLRLQRSSSSVAFSSRFSCRSSCSLARSRSAESSRSVLRAALSSCSRLLASRIASASAIRRVPPRPKRTILLSFLTCAPSDRLRASRVTISARVCLRSLSRSSVLCPILTRTSVASWAPTLAISFLRETSMTEPCSTSSRAATAEETTSDRARDLSRSAASLASAACISRSPATRAWLSSRKARTAPTRP